MQCSNNKDSNDVQVKDKGLALPAQNSSGSTAGSDNCGAAASEEINNSDVPKKFVAYMSTRSGSLYPFSMHLTNGELRICTVQKSIVKKSIELATTHAKVCDNVIRDASSEDDCPQEEVKGSTIWYPVKLLLSQTKARAKAKAKTKTKSKSSAHQKATEY